MTFPEERFAITEILKGRGEHLTVIADLGAHEGEDTAWMLEVVADKNPIAILVEPDEVNFEKLARNLSGTSCFFFKAAIANYDGECYFWENRDSGGGFGSIYNPVPGQLSVDYSKFKKVGPVKCLTFDTLFQQVPIDHIDLLWVDLHGAEKDMIQCGQHALKHTKYLFMEAVDTRLYEGSATADELLAMLPGWTLLRKFPWNLLLQNEDYERM